MPISPPEIMEAAGGGRWRMTRVLGIDPGSRVTGYGVIESDGVRSRHLDSGCIRTLSGDFPDRLGEIFKRLRAVLGRVAAG